MTLTLVIIRISRVGCVHLSRNGSEIRRILLNALERVNLDSAVLQGIILVCPNEIAHLDGDTCSQCHHTVIELDLYLCRFVFFPLKLLLQLFEVVDVFLA